jgi:hypothetical protein
MIRNALAAVPEFKPILDVKTHILTLSDPMEQARIVPTPSMHVMALFFVVGFWPRGR